MVALSNVLFKSSISAVETKVSHERIVKNNSINNNNKYLNILYIKKIFSMYMKRVYDPKKYEGHTPHILQTVHPNKLLFQIPIKPVPSTTGEVKKKPEEQKLT